MAQHEGEQEMVRQRLKKLSQLLMMEAHLNFHLLACSSNRLLKYQATLNFMFLIC